MSVPGRNAPCPCGSGKRYKECHGALAVSAGARAVADPERTRLDAALAAQQAGRYTEAIALYEAVIAEHPHTFDAVHMLGVVHFQRGEFVRARELLTRALEIMPRDAGARHNLQLVDSALERRAIARTICAEILPRFARRCIAAPLPAIRSRWHDGTADVIIAKADMRDAWDEVTALTRWLGIRATVWLYPGTVAPTLAPSALRTIDPERGDLPQHDVTIFFGADISPATWYPRSHATDIALFCDADDPSLLVDRIPELAREGRTPLHLLFKSTAIARRIGLPGCVVESTATPPRARIRQ